MSTETSSENVTKPKKTKKKSGGRNCAMYGCFASENGLHPGVRYFQITTRNSEYYDYEGWRNNIINVLTKYREMNISELKERVMKGNVYICDRHYADEDIEYTGKFPFWLFLNNINIPAK